MNLNDINDIDLEALRIVAETIEETEESKASRDSILLKITAMQFLRKEEKRIQSKELKSLKKHLGK